MPTGYTADVENGKITELEPFVMRCARAFGALIHMRDDSLDTDIVEATPSDYHVKSLNEARTRLAVLETMPSDVAEAEASKAYDDTVKERDRYQARVDRENARYDAMLAKVREWTPPTSEHVKLKEFMVQQLTDSKSKFYDDLYQPKRLSGAAWTKQAIATAKKDIAYHEKELAEDIARCNGRNEWLRQLRDSLQTTTA